MNSKDKYFDELKRRVDFLTQNPDRDNEASRHDQLIYPILTSEYGLGWQPGDLISQSTISVTKHIKESHIFRGAVPKLRKPDILICPPGFEKNIALIEEKQRQNDVKSLNDHRLQVHEYQSLYQCTWGVLSDGERWIVKRNFETYHEYSSIDELARGIRDLQNSLGREQTIKRIAMLGTADILIVLSGSIISTKDAYLPSNCEIYGFENNIPVTVCGVDNREVTPSGLGVEKFNNLEAAIRAYPDLHPRICTKRFTWAMKEIKDNVIKQLRFETWNAYDFYST